MMSTQTAKTETAPAYLDDLADLLDAEPGLADWREAVFSAALTAGASPKDAIELARSSARPA